jgi:hypothetical protein
VKHSGLKPRRRDGAKTDAKDECLLFPIPGFAQRTQRSKERKEEETSIDSLCVLCVLCFFAFFAQFCWFYDSIGTSYFSRRTFAPRLPRSQERQEEKSNISTLGTLGSLAVLAQIRNSFASVFAPSRFRGWLTIPLLICIGCHESHLPTYPRTDTATELKLLSNRARQIQTISGSGSLELTQPDGQSVQLDLAVAMRPPDRARLRAWKFGNAVLDLTLTDDELWLESSQDSSHKSQIAAAGVSAAQVAKMWALLSGGFFNSPNLVAHDRGDVLIVRHGNIVCTVDRDTLTPRQYQMQDDTGRTQFSLSLDDYRQFGDLVWPMRITAVSSSGRVVVRLDDVQLNQELPDTAFKPPRRAEKLP